MGYCEYYNCKDFKKEVFSEDDLTYISHKDEHLLVCRNCLKFLCNDAKKELEEREKYNRNKNIKDKKEMINLQRLNLNQLNNIINND